MGFYLNKKTAIKMKTLALLLVILSVAYIGEAKKGKKPEELAPEIAAVEEDDVPEWGAILRQVRAKLANEGEEVRAKVEAIVEKYELEEKIANAAERAEGAAEVAMAKGKKALLEIDAALDEHGVDLREIMSDAKSRLSTFVQNARGYIGSWRDWWSGSDSA